MDNGQQDGHGLIGLLVVGLLVIVAPSRPQPWLLKRSGLAQGAMGALRHRRARCWVSWRWAPGQRIVTVEVGQGRSRKPGWCWA